MGTISTIQTTILDLYPATLNKGKRPQLVLLGICITAFLLGLNLTTNVSLAITLKSKLIIYVLNISMMTSSNGNIFRVIGPLWGESTGHRWIPLTKASDAELWCFLWPRLTKWLSKQSRRRWFEIQSHSLWRHCYVRRNISTCICMVCHSSTLTWHRYTWNRSPWKTRTYLFYKDIIVGAVDLAAQGDRASATTILTYAKWHNSCGK